jgi:hypothetical protein
MGYPRELRHDGVLESPFLIRKKLKRDGKKILASRKIHREFIAHW